MVLPHPYALSCLLINTGCSHDWHTSAKPYTSMCRQATSSVLVTQWHHVATTTTQGLCFPLGRIITGVDGAGKEGLGHASV
jgi:hypothetical protein